MRFDASMESLLNVGRSESFVDLNQSLGSKFLPQQGIINLKIVYNSPNIILTNYSQLKLHQVECEISVLVHVTASAAKVVTKNPLVKHLV